jgi:hypothetical protein
VLITALLRLTLLQQSEEGQPTPEVPVRLAYQPPASHNKSATNNQSAVLFSQNKPAPTISHQPNEQADGLENHLCCAPILGNDGHYGSNLGTSNYGLLLT